MTQVNNAAETIRKEITDALELLDNVTAYDHEADTLGQAELALIRATEAIEPSLSLFAAAPDMLAELERLVAGNYGQPWGVTVPALDNARAIIAKAKGQTPTG